MDFDKDLVAGKLRRWENYLKKYRLPDWDAIPDDGMLMTQVIRLLGEYLDYLPPELKEETFLTSSTINNYVRQKIMPEPVKKRYYRVHIVYLIFILSLKTSMSISRISKLVPVTLTEAELRTMYTTFTARHAASIEFFCSQIRLMAGPILSHDDCDEGAGQTVEELMELIAVVTSFNNVLTEKLMQLEGHTLADGGSIELI